MDFERVEGIGRRESKDGGGDVELQQERNASGVVGLREVKEG